MSFSTEDVSALPLDRLLDLKGHAAVVTGGAAGIGAATVSRLAEAGADVVVADIDENAATATAADVASRTGRRVIAHKTDVAEPHSIAELAEWSATTLGRLDFWVNNAGIYPPSGPVTDVSNEFLEQMVRVNLQGAFIGGPRGCQADGQWRGHREPGVGGPAFRAHARAQCVHDGQTRDSRPDACAGRRARPCGHPSSGRSPRLCRYPWYARSGCRANRRRSGRRQSGRGEPVGVVAGFPTTLPG